MSRKSTTPSVRKAKSTEPLSRLRSFKPAQMSDAVFNGRCKRVLDTDLVLSTCRVLKLSIPLMTERGALPRLADVFHASIHPDAKHPSLFRDSLEVPRARVTEIRCWLKASVDPHNALWGSAPSPTQHKKEE